MKKFMGYMLVMLLCATSASAFSFDFNKTQVIEVSRGVSPRIPLWQTAVVEEGDIFSEYCVNFLRITGLHRYYSLSECRVYIKAVNGYTDEEVHWIYPGQIVWLPSPQNVRLGEVDVDRPFANIEQLRILLGLDALEAKIDALPDESRVGEMVSEATQGLVNDTMPNMVTSEVEQQLSEKVSQATQGYVDSILPNLVTHEVGRQMSEVESTTVVVSKEKRYVSWWFFWLVAFVLFCLALLGILFSWLRHTVDNTTRQIANEAKTVAKNASTKADEAKAIANSATTKTELGEVSEDLSNKLQAVDKRVSTVEVVAGEASELAASAMAMLCFGDFRVVNGFPSQSAIEKLKPNEELLVTLAHVDDEKDVRVIRFTCIPNAFDDDRDGLKIEGITGQRRPIVKRRSNMATALANGAKANHLQGIEEEPQ